MLVAKQKRSPEVADAMDAQIICKYLHGIPVAQIENTGVARRTIDTILKANAIPRNPSRVKMTEEKLELLLTLLYSEEPSSVRQMADILGVSKRLIEQWIGDLREGESDPKIRAEIERVIGRPLRPELPENTVSLLDESKHPPSLSIRPRKEMPSLIRRPSMSGPGGI